MKIRRSLLNDTVAVETFQGHGVAGPLHADPVQVACLVDLTRRLVRGADGQEVVSELTLTVHPDDESSFTPESRITQAGRTSTVLAVSPQGLRGRTVLVKVACS